MNPKKDLPSSLGGLASLVSRQNLHMRGRPGRKKRAWGATAEKHRKRKAMRETGKYPGKNAIAMRPPVGLGLMGWWSGMEWVSEEK